jgi:hypothetical protein
MATRMKRDGLKDERMCLSGNGSDVGWEIVNRDNGKPPKIVARYFAKLRYQCV